MRWTVIEHAGRPVTAGPFGTARSTGRHHRTQPRQPPRAARRAAADLAPAGHRALRRRRRRGAAQHERGAAHQRERAHAGARRGIARGRWRPRGHRELCAGSCECAACGERRRWPRCHRAPSTRCAPPPPPRLHRCRRNAGSRACTWHAMPANSHRMPAARVPGLRCVLRPVRCGRAAHRRCATDRRVPCPRAGTCAATCSRIPPRACTEAQPFIRPPFAAPVQAPPPPVPQREARAVIADSFRRGLGRHPCERAAARRQHARADARPDGARALRAAIAGAQEPGRSARGTEPACGRRHVGHRAQARRRSALVLRERRQRALAAVRSAPHRARRTTSRCSRRERIPRSTCWRRPAAVQGYSHANHAREVAAQFRPPNPVPAPVHLHPRPRLWRSR
jgi:FHA domain-containing protein